MEAKRGGIPYTPRPRQKSRPGISEKLRRHVLQRDGLYCRYCGYGPMKLEWWPNRYGTQRLYYRAESMNDPHLTLDHRKPVSKGGTTTAWNLVVCCSSCNSRKATGKAKSPLRETAPMCLLPAPPDVIVPFKPFSFL